MKYWVFDLDGTLVDSFSHYFAALKELFAEHGVALTDQQLRRSYDISAKDFLLEHLDAEKAAACYAQLMERAHAESKLICAYDGIEDNLRALQESGARMAVWTARDLESARLILEEKGWYKYFELCVSGTCVTQNKPHPEGLERIFSHFKCAPEEAVMIGDHHYDVAAAKTLGAKGIRVSWNTHWNKEACSIADHQFYEVPHFSSWVAETLGR